MFAAIRRRATFANVVATIALVLAVGGGSAYALQGRNTVFSDDIAPNEVKASDANEASFKTPRILKSASSAASTMGSQVLVAIAECPRGYSVTGGGFRLGDSTMSVRDSSPYTAQTNYDSWYVEAVSSGAEQSVVAYAVCERGTTLPPSP